MGLVLLALFLVLTFTASPWWLLPAGAALFGGGEWIVITVIIVLAVTVSPLWLFGFFVLLLL